MLHALGSGAKLAVIRRQCGPFRQFWNCGTELNPGKCHCSRRNRNSAGGNNSNNSGIHIPKRNSKYNRARVHHARCNAKLNDSRNSPEYHDSRFHVSRCHARSHHSRVYCPKRNSEYNHAGVDFP
jgi:hypothetical protein